MTYTTGLTIQENEPGNPESDWLLIAEPSFVIGIACAVMEDNRPDESVILAPVKANALLWAAAPELLEALIACREGIDILMARIIEAAPQGADPVTYHPSKSGKPWDAFILARAAILKATGSDTI